MILTFIKKIINKKKWRRLNKHNFTTYEFGNGDLNKIHIGKYTYGPICVWSTDPNYEIYIGSFCSIGNGVKFLLSMEHPCNKISTYPFKARILNNGIDAISKGNIVVDDDVWFGQNAIILSGVHIGQGAVIAAGAVVTHDVPPYAIAGGVPAKVIKYRFDEKLINELLKINYDKLTKDQINVHINELYEPLNDISQLDWMEKKN